MTNLTFELLYEWDPFIIAEKHLTFLKMGGYYLNGSSHKGPSVYKWDGIVNQGPRAGQRGILIGETGDLHRRIREYRHGTHKSGNKYGNPKCREEFLDRGDIYLYVLRIASGTPVSDVSVRSIRKEIERRLIQDTRRAGGTNLWIVNEQYPV